MKSAHQLMRLAAISLTLLAGCGTQIGNPTGSGAVRPTDNSVTLGTLVNAGFMQTVDSINMGDYGYSRLESRVSTDRTCQTAAGSKLSLVDKAETKHSVIDESDEWYVKSDLMIKRSYQDAWIYNGKLLACSPDTKTISFDYKKLHSAALSMNSLVEEELSRNLSMTEKKLGQDLKQNTVSKKTGNRTLRLLDYTEDQKGGVLVEAQLSSEMQSVVTLDQGAKKVTMQLADRFPLQFSIHLDGKNQWTGYDIEDGKQEFAIAESSEVLRLEFKNLKITQASACVPESGELIATVIRPNLPNVRYSINFKPKQPLVLQREDGPDTLILAPFACVLKEK